MRHGSAGSSCLPVGLALCLTSLLGLLRLGNVLLTRSLTNFWLLVAARVDQVNRGTNDTTLALDGATRALLGNFFRHTLLVHTAVQNRPGKLTWVLALVEQRFRLRALEAENL